MTTNYIQQAKNGWGNYVTFDNKPVYYHYHHGTSWDILGEKLNTIQWITENVSLNQPDIARITVSFMMRNWELYENGWLVDNRGGRHLFNYLCDIGTGSRPIALDYLI